MLRSVVSEIAMGKVIRKRFWKDFIVEALVAAGFIASVRLFPPWIGCAVYTRLLAVNFAINVSNRRTHIT